MVYYPSNQTIVYEKDGIALADFNWDDFRYPIWVCNDADKLGQGLCW
ncbi:chorismate synthase [Maribacter sp. HTCC2170]|nr:chorismate synthase [Maribacter sp. HTCC2170]